MSCVQYSYLCWTADVVETCLPRPCVGKPDEESVHVTTSSKGQDLRLRAMFSANSDMFDVGECTWLVFGKYRWCGYQCINLKQLT
jgi:hypothetical protein